MPDDFELLERELGRLSRAISYPATPSLAGTVGERLTAPGRPVTSRPGRWALAGAALAAAVALALALGVWSPGREAVADFFDRLNILETEESPEGLPREIVGTPVSPEEAEERLGLPLQEPTYPKGLELKETLLQVFPGFQAAVVFYEHPSGVTFTLFQTAGAVGKGVPVRLEAVAGATPVAGVGEEAYWLVGLRIVEYMDEEGNVIRDSRRATDTNTLAWQEGGIVYRIEGDLSQEEAISIAESLR